MLLIIFFDYRDIFEQIIGEIHRADYLFNEGNFTDRQAVFRVEISVRPLSGPILRWHEGVNLTRGVLRRFVQKNQQAREPTGEVGQNTLGLALGIKRPDAQIGFGTDAARLTNEGCTEDAMRIGVAIAGAGRSAANINLPLVNSIGCRPSCQNL